jgi:thiol-disulfide isomerase/thioredoxin
MGRARSRWPLWTALATACLWVGIAHADLAETPAAPDWNDPGIAWHAYRDGMREIIRTGKPGVLLFFTEWCPQCRTYSRVFHDPEIVALSRRFVMIRVDRDQNDALNSFYAKGGSYVPRTMFLREDRTVDWSMRGGNPEYPHFLETGSSAELKTLMKRFLVQH